ncbi:hypothetical protein LN650_06925 [Klebsiella pneumoniae subsp. pneumoniae]|nr:hypothetical protein [Klebsiella pneumoniae subsp. pneumoniae]
MATAKEGLCAVCWRYFNRRGREKPAPGILAQDPAGAVRRAGLRGQLSAPRSQGLSALSEAVLAAARER